MLQKSQQHQRRPCTGLLSAAVGIILVSGMLLLVPPLVLFHLPRTQKGAQRLAETASGSLSGHEDNGKDPFPEDSCIFVRGGAIINRNAPKRRLSAVDQRKKGLGMSTALQSRLDCNSAGLSSTVEESSSSQQAVRELSTANKPYRSATQHFPITPAWKLLLQSSAALAKIMGAESLKTLNSSLIGRLLVHQHSLETFALPRPVWAHLSVHCLRWFHGGARESAIDAKTGLPRGRGSPNSTRGALPRGRESPIRTGKSLRRANESSTSQRSGLPGPSQDNMVTALSGRPRVQSAPYTDAVPHRSNTVPYAERAPLTTAAGIPGTLIDSPEAARLFQQALDCRCTQGSWVVDPTPRLLPWPRDGSRGGMCDERWVRGHRGRLAWGRADAVVVGESGGGRGRLALGGGEGGGRGWADAGIGNKEKGGSQRWRVRPSLKYVWQVDEEKCGKGGHIGDVPGEEMVRILLREGNAKDKFSNHPPTVKRNQKVGQGRVTLVRDEERDPSSAMLALSSAETSIQEQSKVRGSFGDDTVGDQPGHFDGDNVAAQGTPQGPLAQRSERLVLVVGDSMQTAWASSILDTLRMGLTKTSQLLLRPISPSLLPCHVPGGVEKMLCWGTDIVLGLQGTVKLVFVRNDFLSLVSSIRMTRGGKNVELPWLDTLRKLQQEITSKQGAATMTPDSNKSSQHRAMLTSDTSPSPATHAPLPPLLLLNRGAHFSRDNDFFPELHATMLGTRRMCPECLILFRNTPPGHASCKRIKQPLVIAQADSGVYSWKEIAKQSQSPLAKKIVEGVGGVFLDVKTMTSLRGDGHVEKSRKGVYDCLHYCAPGPVDSWTRLLFQTLAEILTGKAR